MQRSTHRFLTTHVGSLPAPDGFADEGAVRELVKRQRDTGLDIVNEGEYTKGGDWLSFTDDRFGGFTAGQRKGPPVITMGKDREEFAAFYKWASQRGTIFFEPGDQIKTVRNYWVCTGPVTYTGQDVLRREIELLKGAAGFSTRWRRRCGRSTRQLWMPAFCCKWTMRGCRRCGTGSGSVWGSKLS
jgi:5-methyltetrahydropteroyltriglutamate--homocysteine methyltransferase